PWQGRTLPTELCPHLLAFNYSAASAIPILPHEGVRTVRLEITGTTRSRPLDRNSVRVQLAIEVRSLHAEGVGGTADVAGKFAEPEEDVLLLELVPRVLERQVWRDG